MMGVYIMHTRAVFTRTPVMHTRAHAQAPPRGRTGRRDCRLPGGCRRVRLCGAGGAGGGRRFTIGLVMQGVGRQRRGVACARAFFVITHTDSDQLHHHHHQHHHLLVNTTFVCWGVCCVVWWTVCVCGCGGGGGGGGGLQMIPQKVLDKLQVCDGHDADQASERERDRRWRGEGVGRRWTDRR